MIKVDERLGTIAELFALAIPKVLPLLQAGHELILSLDPNCTVVPRLGEKSLSYGLGPKKMSEAYCYLMPFKEHINLGFFHGTNIDENGILEGTGAKLRHLKITSLEQLESAEFIALIRKAIEDRLVAKNASN